MNKTQKEEAFYAGRKKYIEALDAAVFDAEYLQALVEEKLTLDTRTGLDIEDVSKAIAASVTTFFNGLRTRDYEEVEHDRWRRRLDWESVIRYIKGTYTVGVDIGVYKPKNRSEADFIFTRSGRMSVQRYDLMQKGELSEAESFCIEARQPIAISEKYARELISEVAKKLGLLPYWVRPTDLVATKITFCRPESEKRTPRARALIQADRRSHIRDNIRSCTFRLREHNYAEDPEELLGKADYHLKLYKGPEAEEALKQTQQLREDYEEAKAEIARIVNDLEARFRSLSAFVSNMS